MRRLIIFTAGLDAGHEQHRHKERHVRKRGLENRSVPQKMVFPDPGVVQGVFDYIVLCIYGSFFLVGGLLSELAVYLGADLVDVAEFRDTQIIGVYPRVDEAGDAICEKRGEEYGEQYHRGRSPHTRPQRRFP